MRRSHPETFPFLFLLALGCGAGQSVPPATACSNLNGLTIAASAIGLPTTGATVTATTLQPASGTAPSTIGEYCKVLVSIHPVDPAAPAILAQVNLPSTWNGKALMFGGGGYDGTLAGAAGGGAGNYFNGPTNKPVPLGQGYATFASDSGHEANALGSEDGSFGTNAEALANFAGDALKKTHDVAMALIGRRYGVQPSRTYFVGGSSGGREALAVAQRWPLDFDGAISMYPAWNAATLDLQFGRITRALAADGAYPDTAKKKVWMNGVLAACDALDGVADGIVSNLAACNFDPSAVRCPGGNDTGDTCLSDAQIAAITTYGTDLNLQYGTGSGEFQYPGFNVFAGADLTGPLDLNATQPSSALTTGSQLAPAYKAMPYFSVFWDQWIKYIVTGQPGFDSLTIDPEHPGQYQQKISSVLGLMDVNKTDLSEFQGRGGKLLLMHGQADGLVATRATVDYYHRLVSAMGAPKTASFVRFYLVPGLGHVFGSPFGAGFQLSWDPLAALEGWVENGTAPPGLVGTDTAAPTKGRTRPICEYPNWPKYSGSGNANAAASFTCVAN